METVGNAEAQHLKLLTSSRQLVWRERSVTYPECLELLLLAALRTRRPLGPSDLERYALRSGMQFSSLRTELYTFMATCRAVWGESGPLEKVAVGREKHYRFLESIGELSCDLAEFEVGHALDFAPPRSSLPLMFTLMQAERLFEQGRYAEAGRILAAADVREAHPEQEVALRCLQNWVCLQLEEDGQKVRRSTKELAAWFKAFDTREREISDLVRARVLIQCARTPMNYQQRREARRLYHKAAKLLPAQAWREWAAVEAGLGYVETRGKGGSLSAAEHHYRAALHYATLARWPWSVQVQLGNLADLLWQQYTRLPEQPRQHPLLSEAKALLTESLYLCQLHHFRGSGETELYRARIAICQGDLVAADEDIKAAFVLLGESEESLGYALGCEVRGEWYVALGETERGLSELRVAATLEEKLGTGVDGPRLRSRIAQLEGREHQLSLQR